MSDKPEIKKIAQEPKKDNGLHYYSVRVETLVPAIIEYKVLAHSPEEAAVSYYKKPPYNITYKLTKRLDKMLSVYSWGTLLLHIKKMISVSQH